jgi:outer membrane murein-binding lipoprotein Lpp
MTIFLTMLVCIACVYVTPSLARIYRWTDEAGRVHYTDNPGTIPPNRRGDSRELSGDTSRSKASGTGTVAPSPATTPPLPSGVPQDASSDKVGHLRQRVKTLERQIDEARQERQGYLEQLKAMRAVRTNPAFGRRRRRVEDVGHSLAAVERQLDMLQAELQQVQTELRQVEQPQPSASSASAPGPLREVRVDLQGHNRAYWQRRLGAVHTRLRQAQEQRQTVLERLASEHQGPYGRRGEEVLRLTQTLEQLGQDMRGAEAALQALRQEATRAGAPAEWLQ